MTLKLFRWKKDSFHTRTETCTRESHEKYEDKYGPKQQDVFFFDL